EERVPGRGESVCVHIPERLAASDDALVVGRACERGQRPLALHLNPERPCNSLLQGRARLLAKPRAGGERPLARVQLEHLTRPPARLPVGPPPGSAPAPPPGPGGNPAAAARPPPAASLDLAAQPVGALEVAGGARDLTALGKLDNLRRGLRLLGERA